MKRATIRLTLVAAAGLALGVPGAAWPWGSTGHRHIAQNYSKHLPPTLDGLAAWDAVVDAHVMDPDARKSSVPGESYRHYMDIDYYPEFFSGNLPHERATLEAMYGPSTVLQKGVLPWAVDEVVTTLSSQMAAAEWDAAALTIADLCHYVGDGHVPLHCTLNYDGQFTGNNGIHARWESQMINLFVGEIEIPVGPTESYPSVVDAMFDLITESWGGVESILAADDDAKSASGGSYSPLYYQTLWYYTGTLAADRMIDAARRTASMVVTAWLAGGSPPVPGSTVSAIASPGGDPGPRLWLGPNPFTDRLRVRWEGEGPCTVEIFDARGARLATLAKNGPPASVSWRPERDGLPAAAGVYWVRLSTPAGEVAGKAVLLH